MATNITFNADGYPGRDGQDGHHGGHGFTGGRGGDGSDAGHAQPGMRGGECRVTLCSNSFDVLQITGFAARANGERFVAQPQPIHASALGEVIISARGGKGGNGGNGGNGGDGGDGHRGRDATRHSDGTDGGNGGNGGDGGLGTDGANGGDGGVIEVFVHERDLYLLMAVKDSEDPQGTVAGGAGGRRGSHGHGGRGGSGGWGGSSYSWTESEEYTDAQGHRQTRHHHHSRPGGSNGWSGSSGHTPTSALHDGRDGSPGNFSIAVEAESGLTNTYRRRFEVELVEFQLAEDSTKDVDGIIEFGEVIHVKDIRLRNVGGMPTPPKQRVRLTLVADRWMKPLGDELFLAQSVPPGGEVVIPGTLRFEIPDVRIETPGDPFVVHQPARLVADQLGMEEGAYTGGKALFQRRYPKTQFHRVVTAQFPLENRDGIVALRSLASGETTKFSFGVSNISQKALGESSVRKRRVGVQVELIGGELSHSDLVFFDHEGRKIDLAQQMEGFQGYFTRLLEIPAKETVYVRGQIGVREGLPPYIGAELRATLWMDDHRQPNRWRIVQRRVMTIRIEPVYTYHRDSKLLLVTNNNTTQDAFLAWERLFRDSLGVKADCWSISRYGHFNLRQDLPDGTDLRTHLEDRMALILNQDFNARGTEETDLPTEYLRGRDFREGAIQHTHFAVIGSPKFSMRQLLEPTSDIRKGGDDFAEEERFFQKEEKSAGVLVEETFKEDILTYFDLVEMHDWTFFYTPSPTRMEKLSKKLQRKLITMHPDRRYVLVMRPYDTPKRDGSSFIFPRWSFGKLEVRRSLNTETSAALVLQVPDKTVNEVSFIESDEARLAVLLALPFPDKLERLNWCLQQPEPIEKELLRTMKIVVQAILIDLSEEQSSLRRGSGPLDDEFLNQKLANLGRLIKYPLYTRLAANSSRWEPLIELAAGLQAMAAGHFRWWRLWGRHKYLSKYLLAKLKPYFDELFNAYVVDPNGDIAMEGGTAQARIDNRQRVLEQLFRDRYAKERLENGKKLSYDTAVHLYFEQPDTLRYRLIRDIDAWTNPEELLWSEADLQKAQEQEEWREAKQEQLRKINEQTRTEMLVDEKQKDAQAQGVPEEVVVTAKQA